jgi:ribosomal protein L11 methyltransferase
MKPTLKPHPAFPDSRPVEVGTRFLLVPEGMDCSETNPKQNHRIPIKLSRGKAFGSGLHETTVSCIEVLEGLDSLTSMSVLDVGTGTGILSLAALLLGARRAVAFDIDIDAALNCSRNAALNQVEDQLKVFQGTVEALTPSARYDLVIANIHGDIILKEAYRLTSHTSEEGHLVLSGIDYTDSSQIKTTMRKNGMEKVSVVFMEEFVTQVWRRPPERHRTKL